MRTGAPQTCHRSVLLALLPLLLCAGSPLRADPAEKSAPKIFELSVQPAAEPVPALKYHLVPPVEEQVRGNAVPIYLRVIYEHSQGEWHRQLRDEPSRLLEFPIADLPLDKVEKILSTYSDVLEQISAAGLRSSANWEYVLEGDPLTTLLPDAQSMRNFARLIALRTRYEVRQRNAAAAISSTRDGMALARHVSAAPFLVNQLIGIAISQVMLAEVDVIVQMDGAPNLYWALAALPQPVISLEAGLATDSKLLELRFPELGVPKASINWQELAPRMRQWAIDVAKSEGGAEATLLTAMIEKPPTARKLSEAREQLPHMTEFTPAQVAAMSDAELEVRHTVALHRLIYDAWRKWYNLPYSQVFKAAPKLDDDLRKETRRREMYPLVSLLTPLRTSLLTVQARTGREIARLQLIEALRMHAAATGKLPATLEEITVVPVPLDPGTGGPFSYKLDADTATIDVTDPADMTLDALRLPVRITLRE